MFIHSKILSIPTILPNNTMEISIDNVTKIYKISGVYKDINTIIYNQFKQFIPINISHDLSMIIDSKYPSDPDLIIDFNLVNNLCDKDLTSIIWNIHRNNIGQFISSVLERDYWSVLQYIPSVYSARIYIPALLTYNNIPGTSKYVMEIIYGYKYDKMTIKLLKWNQEDIIPGTKITSNSNVIWALEEPITLIKCHVFKYNYITRVMEKWIVENQIIQTP